MQTIKKFTDEQLKQIDVLVAIHLFGYAWFYFPGQDETKDIPHGDPNYRPKVGPFCSLPIPAEHQKRHGMIRVDHPHPGDEIDISIPYYHKDEEYVVEIMEMSLTVDGEHPLVLHKFGDGYCYGDVQKDHYESIPLALVMFTLANFKVPVPF